MVFAVNRSRSLPGLIYQALRSSICHGNTISLDFHVYILAAWSQFARELGAGASKFAVPEAKKQGYGYVPEATWLQIDRPEVGGVRGSSPDQSLTVAICVMNDFVSCYGVRPPCCVFAFSDTSTAKVTCSPSYTDAQGLTLDFRIPWPSQRKLYCSKCILYSRVRASWIEFNLEVRHRRCVGSITKNIVYYTYSQTQL